MYPQIPAENAVAGSYRPCRILSIGLIVACFAGSHVARAVSPPPDGGYFGANTAEGDSALLNLTTGTDNTAVGSFALSSNINGNRNTAVGPNALSSSNFASDNTAVGAFSLSHNTTGSNNTAIAGQTLTDNTTGRDNTATGHLALDFNITGSDNTATGFAALLRNVRGIDNTATGVSALSSDKDSSFNTATGFQALFANTASNNTADGFEALVSNTTGTENTATGGATLFNTTTGNNNTADGFEALFSNTTGNNNIAVGILAGQNLTTGSNNIDIGNAGKAGEANTIRIGTKGTQTGTFIAGISGVAVTGSQVVVNGTGKLGVAASSARFKDDVRPMDKASEAILALTPVSFHYKHELDPDDIPQFGLVAEQVEKIAPELVACDEQGKPYTVRYDAVNAMLLNEFLKEHRTVQEQQSTITNLKCAVAEQGKQIQSLNAAVQKLSNHAEKQTWAVGKGNNIKMDPH